MKSSCVSIIAALSVVATVRIALNSTIMGRILELMCDSRRYPIKMYMILTARKWPAVLLGQDKFTQERLSRLRELCNKSKIKLPPLIPPSLATAEMSTLQMLNLEKTLQSDG